MNHTGKKEKLELEKILKKNWDKQDFWIKDDLKYDCPFHVSSCFTPHNVGL